MADWLDLLKAEVNKTSKAAVARRLGYSRPAISLACHGRYPGSTDKLKAQVLAVLAGQIACPVTGEALSRAEFDQIRASPMPTSNPKRLKQWLALRQMADAEAAPPAQPADA
ncbi:hypothetical protein ACUXV3_12440 [Roseobacteraceae bacterium NS-SX3]